MSSSRRSRLYGRVVIDHHDVLYLVRHHHIPLSDHGDTLVVFVLDAAQRLSHTFLSVEFPRASTEAIEQLTEHLLAVAELPDAASVVACWCTGPTTHPTEAVEQLRLLGSALRHCTTAGLELFDLYWITPLGYVSLSDQPIPH
jgi:hypothetical protein